MLLILWSYSLLNFLAFRNGHADALFALEVATLKRAHRRNLIAHAGDFPVLLIHALIGSLALFLIHLAQLAGLGLKFLCEVTVVVSALLIVVALCPQFIVLPFAVFTVFGQILCQLLIVVLSFFVGFYLSLACLGLLQLGFSFGQ